MKKATELKNWISAWWERQIKKDVVNIKENEESIMALLMWCNGSRLTTEERLILYTTIESRFKAIISRDKIQMTKTVIAIDEFECKQPIKSVVKNTVFDEPIISNIEVVFDKVEP